MSVTGQPDEPEDSEADGLPEEESEILIECPYCDGTGHMGSEGIMADCPECGGTGWE